MATKTNKKTIPLKKVAPKKQVKTPAAYDPSKNYLWTPEDTFTLDGKEFAQLYNGLAPLANLLAPALHGFSVLQAKFEQGVAAGVIKEQETQQG